MNTDEHIFQLPDMSCGHCVATITRALGALGAQVQADLAAHQVRVWAPPGLGREALAQALTAAGYAPKASG